MRKIISNEVIKIGKPFYRLFRLIDSKTNLIAQGLIGNNEKKSTGFL